MIYDGQVCGLLVFYLCYDPSKSCGWILGNKVIVCLILAFKFLGKEGIWLAVQTGVTWKQDLKVQV